MESLIKLAILSSSFVGLATPTTDLLPSSTPTMRIPPAPLANATSVRSTFSGELRSRLNSSVLLSGRLSRDSRYSMLGKLLGTMRAVNASQYSFPFQGIHRTRCTSLHLSLASTDEAIPLIGKKSLPRVQAGFSSMHHRAGPHICSMCSMAGTAFRELTFNFLDQIPVRKREPCFRRVRGLDAKERIALDDLSPAVQEHGVSGGRSCGRELDSGENICLPGARFVDDVDHFGFCGCGDRAQASACARPPVSVRSARSGESAGSGGRIGLPSHRPFDRGPTA